MDTEDNQPTTNSSTQQPVSSVVNLTGDRQKRAQIILMLSRLAIHYYRNDFSEAQARLLIEDLVNDIVHCTIYDIEKAIQSHRRDPRARFFPTSGQILGQIEKARKDAVEAQRVRETPKVKPEFGDSRPIMWWLQRKRFWKPHWRVEDIPEREREPYQRWLAKVKSGEVAGKNPNDY